MRPDTGETADALLAAARTAGFERSKAQLARRHRAGLLPRPRQVPLGRPLGSRTIYPAGTTRQFLALCEIERETRDLEPAAFELWWRGYAVEPRLVRAFLKRSADRWDKPIAKLVRLTRTERGEAGLDQIVDRSATMRISQPALRQARKRLGRSRFSTLVRVVLEVASGRFYDYSRDSFTDSRGEEQALVERGLGIDQARRVEAPGSEPWLQTSSAAALAELSALAKGHPLNAELLGSSMADLEVARDELVRMLTLFVETGQAFRRVLGLRSASIGVLSVALERFRPEDRAQFILFWLMLRRHGPPAFREGYIVLAGAAESWNKEGKRAADALTAMRVELPELAEALSPQRLLAAQRDPDNLEKWQAEVAEIRERHAEELDRFFARHPEYLRD